MDEHEVHRIDKLRQAVRIYGQASLETRRILTSFGRDLLAALGPYLHPEKALVRGVPPRGAWEPGRDYRDDAFSAFDIGVVTFEPFELGIAIRIENLTDDGVLWVRVVVALRKVGEKIHLSIGDDQITSPVRYKRSASDRLRLDLEDSA